MRSRLLRWFAVFVGLGAAFVACDDNNLVNNPSFDLWCGKSLCGWQLDTGSIERVGTWHKKDYGVSFEGASTQISQVSDADPVRCMRFDMIADADPEAQLSLVLDFNNDQREEFEQRITDVRWKSVQFVVRPPLDYKNVRYILRKRSAGHAVIAQLRVVEETENCEGPPLLIEDGGQCTIDASCEHGLCSAGVCSDCAPRVGGEVSCAEQSLCHRDSQCGGGVCAGGLCQGCASEGKCPALAPCDSATDCASGSCVRRFTYSDVVEASACLHCDSPASCGGSNSACTNGVCEVCLLDPFPSQCDECVDDSQCESGVCEFGLCAGCRSDEQCGLEQRCRFPDRFDVGPRTCTGEVLSDLPRGALCETNEECASGLPCGATSADEPKRCGIACEVSSDACGLGAICTRAALSEVDGIVWFPQRTLPGFAEVAGRIATCHPVIQQGGACTLHAECQTGVCCGGACVSAEEAHKNLRTGGCTFTEREGDSE